jgi:protein-L-isoaspartate(D-aspartate) O-methyltransferase
LTKSSPPTHYLAYDPDWNTMTSACKHPRSSKSGECAVPAVPRSWLEQTRPGGIIVTGLWRGTGVHPVVALTVNEDGSAEGRLIRHQGALLPIPGHQTTPPIVMDIRGVRELAEATGEVKPTASAPSGLERADFATFATIALRGIHAIRDRVTNTTWYVTDDGCAVHVDKAAGTVTDYGPRFSDQLIAAHRAWWRAGSPTADRLGLTITAAGEHRYWLDNPERPLWTGRLS